MNKRNLHNPILFLFEFQEEIFYSVCLKKPSVFKRCIAPLKNESIERIGGWVRKPGDCPPALSLLVIPGDSKLNREAESCPVVENKPPLHSLALNYNCVCNIKRRCTRFMGCFFGISWVSVPTYRKILNFSCNVMNRYFRNSCVGNAYPESRMRKHGFTRNDDPSD